MSGLDKLGEYIENGYSMLRWVRKSIANNQAYVIGLGDNEGNVINFEYNPLDDSLSEGRMYKNEGAGKELIEMAERGKVFLATRSKFDDWKGLREFGAWFREGLNEVR